MVFLLNVADQLQIAFPCGEIQKYALAMKRKNELTQITRSRLVEGIRVDGVGRVIGYNGFSWGGHLIDELASLYIDESEPARVGAD